MCRVNGDNTVDGTTTVSVNTSLGPVVLVNVCGPQKLVHPGAAVAFVAVAVAVGVLVGDGVGCGLVNHRTEASKRAQPLTVKLVASSRKQPTRRAGAMAPAMVEPVS
jgi:hypothetical protein